MALTFAREPEAQTAGTTGQGGTQVEHVRVISEIIHMFGLSHERLMSKIRDRGIHNIIERIFGIAEVDPASAVGRHAERVPQDPAVPVVPDHSDPPRGPGRSVQPGELDRPVAGPGGQRLEPVPQRDPAHRLPGSS